MKRILIIEDEKILMEMYSDKLRQEKLTIFCANDAETGLELAEKEQPDLIILDILLPKENGIDFLSKLRKNPKTKNLTVVAFSNYDNPQTKKQAKKFGAKAYLIKTDYTPKEIVKKIKTYLN